MRSEIGWTIEIEIPFRSLNFDPNNDEWGTHFQRTARRTNEDSIWMGWARHQGLRRMANAGLDVFYSPTPGLRSVLTVNTDVAQTEVDQRQVNLSRFSLFFPERRDFFLDGPPFFAFGSPANGDLIVNPVFSRRLGLTPSGTP